MDPRVPQINKETYAAAARHEQDDSPVTRICAILIKTIEIENKTREGVHPIPSSRELKFN